MKLFFLGFCIYAIILVENVSSKPQNDYQIIPGGFAPLSVDSDEVKQLAVFSLSSIAQQSGSTRPLGLVKVVSAKSQVVSGTNYALTLLVCEKNSTNDENTDLDKKSCRSCDTMIWEQLWLNKKNVTKVSCSKPSELVSFSKSVKNN